MFNTRPMDYIKVLLHEKKVPSYKFSGGISYVEDAHYGMIVGWDRELGTFQV